ncbi:MAG: hypothetical protein MjAS7_2531 [Metallosphaera javensis (ex Sakai et al. 2022)]|nr:MAG: hypothetical protein MjAS7_2531 [Metallosphaera javensis (ex Sakai et al. 2022)]
MNDFHFNTNFIEEYLTTLKSVKHYPSNELNPRPTTPNNIPTMNNQPKTNLLIPPQPLTIGRINPIILLVNLNITNGD